MFPFQQLKLFFYRSSFPSTSSATIIPKSNPFGIFLFYNVRLGVRAHNKKLPSLCCLSFDGLTQCVGECKIIALNLTQRSPYARSFHKSQNENEPQFRLYHFDFKKDYSNFPAEFVLELPIALTMFDDVLNVMSRRLMRV
jgi:hypothetical protein